MKVKLILIGGLSCLLFSCTEGNPAGQSRPGTKGNEGTHNINKSYSSDKPGNTPDSVITGY